MKEAAREREEINDELAQVKRRLEEAQRRAQASDCLVELVSMMVPELHLSRADLEEQLKSMEQEHHVFLVSKIHRYCELIDRSLDIAPELVERAEELRRALECVRTYELTFMDPILMQPVKVSEGVLFHCQHRVATNQVVELVRFCAENGQAVRCPSVGCGELLDYSNCSEEDQYKLAQVRKRAVEATGRVLWQRVC